MREVGVDRPGLTNPELLHNHKTQAVHKAVDLIVVPPEVLEGGSFVLLVWTMDASKATTEKALARMDSVSVTGLRIWPTLALAVADQGDRFRDHLRRRHEQIGEPLAALTLEDFTNAVMVVVLSVEERVEKTRV